MIGNLFFGFLTEKFGRKKPLLVSAIPLIVSWNFEWKGSVRGNDETYILNYEDFWFLPWNKYFESLRKCVRCRWNETSFYLKWLCLFIHCSGQELTDKRHTKVLHDSLIILIDSIQQFSDKLAPDVIRSKCLLFVRGTCHKWIHWKRCVHHNSIVPIRDCIW